MPASSMKAVMIRHKAIKMQDSAQCLRTGHPFPRKEKTFVPRPRLVIGPSVLVGLVLKASGLAQH